MNYEPWLALVLISACAVILAVAFWPKGKKRKREPGVPFEH